MTMYLSGYWGIVLPAKVSQKVLNVLMKGKNNEDDEESVGGDVYRCHGLYGYGGYC